MAVAPKVCLDCGQHFMGQRDQPCPKCESDNVMPMSEVPISKLVIQFQTPGSALFNMHPEGIVTPEQLAVVGEFLLTRARAMWRMQLEAAMAQAQEEQEEEGQESQILVPGMHPSQVADILRGMKE